MWGPGFFMIDLELHPLSLLFPPIPEEELAELGRDIALHGQLEPIVLHDGKILDGANRYKACRLMGLEPWTTEFNQERVKRTPEEYVMAANVMRRHLTPGQLATIALAWAEQLESNTNDALFPKSEKTTGRPRTSAIPHASQSLGVRRQAVYEVQEIRAADPSLFQEVRAGRESLGGALKKIRPPAEAEPSMPVSQETQSQAADQDQPVSQADEPADTPPLASKPTAPRLSRKERVEQAWQDIGRIFRFGQKSLDAFRASQRMTDAEALEFQSLESDADKLRMRRAIQNNQSFAEAVKPLASVNPKEPIEKLHTKTLRNDGFFAGQVGEFYHAIVLGDRAALLEHLKGWGAD